MDLYRYFHPHHNPRLRKKSLRLQELGELEQAAKELQKALKRGEIRSESAEESNPEHPIKKEHFSQVLVALDYVVDSLQTLAEAHPGDNDQAMTNLLEERKNAPGWENWVRLLKQRLELLPASELSEPEGESSEETIKRA